jgi:hypothetical protein
VNFADWRSLREDHYKTLIDGRDPLEKANTERIKALADEKFGSKKVQREQFLYEVHVAGQGKTPDEVWKIANDKLDKAPGTGWFGTNIGADQQYKVDLKTRDAERTAWGKAAQDIGGDTVKAVRKGLEMKKGAPASLSDFDAFTKELGGYDAVKPGTPTNNAIQSLIRHKSPVTPANIKAVLQRYPEGNF